MRGAILLRHLMCLYGVERDRTLSLPSRVATVRSSGNEKIHEAEVGKTR